MTDTPQSISTVLITGGTGSFGSALTAYLLDIPDGPRVRIYSRDEEKQERMAARFPSSPRMTYILGDVRDTERLVTALDGCNIVIHSAALKRVGFGERHAGEFNKTNIDGSSNVITAALSCCVPTTILISSDKAVSPVNTYGASKRAAESLFIQANLLGVSRGCKFAVCRGGNVWGSRGSVMEKWETAVECDEPITIYGGHQTRFHLPMPDWTAFVWRVANECHGGEVFLPKLRAWRIEDLAAAYDPREIITRPARNGDKPHEYMLSGDEGGRTKDIGWALAVEPSPDIRAVWNYQEWQGWTPPDKFEYTSEHVNKLSVEELKELICSS